MKYPIAQPVLNGNERKYLIDAFDSTWISSQGKYIAEVEEKFATFCGVEVALTCFNGTVALHLALLAIDLQPGDEVIIPAVTYIATANAVEYMGGKPVFVDIRPDTLNIDENAIEKSITNKTKAIIVVHIYGHPCEMDTIMAIAGKHNILVIEDAAEAHGAIYYSNIDGKKVAKQVGSIGDLGTFSFFANKIITSGEGGMVTTNNPKYAETIRLLKDQGMSTEKRYWFPVIGYNYRMTNLQAAILLGQLEKVEWHLAQRRRIAERYITNLKDNPLIVIPPELENVKSSYWMFTMVLSGRIAHRRDEVMAELRNRGVDSRPIFYPLPEMPPYFEENHKVSYPISFESSYAGFNLPSSNYLTNEDIDFICGEVNDVVRQVENFS